MTEVQSKTRVVLVTGSTSGIGLAIAKRLAEDGFAIAFHSKSSVEAGRAIAPGSVDTPISQNWTAARELWEMRSPMQRGAKPEEIAQIASLLIASHYLTGEIVIADGGLNLT